VSPIPHKKQATERVRVLIVDDFEDAREMYVEFLALNGYDVIAAADGLEAIRVAETVVPDVIVLDINLPRLNGFSVLRKLKADSRTRSIRVITLSASAGLAYREESGAAGAAMAMEKPCTPEELLSAIVALTGR
jgi:two-component system, cell cycle response regulator DivK